MRKITSTGQRGGFDIEAALFWIFAGIILVIAFGDALTIVGAAVAAVVVVSWLYRKVVNRGHATEPAMASVTHLRPQSVGHADAEGHQPHAA